MSPVGYGGKPIDLKGYFDTGLSYKDRSINICVFVSLVGDALLSWLHQKLLGVVLNPNANPQIQLNEIVLDKADFTKEFPKAFSESLGCLNGYRHERKLKKKYHTCST
mgnify:CR=1 FL=1